MGRTPDRFPGPREDEELVLQNRTEEPAAAGAMRFVNGAFRLRDVGGAFDPRIDSAQAQEQHNALDTLVHGVAEDAHVELVRDGAGRVSSIVHWTDATKTTKVREEVLTRDAQGRVSQVEARQYDAAGSLKQTLTTVLSRNTAGRVVLMDLAEA